MSEITAVVVIVALLVAWGMWNVVSWIYDKVTGQ